MTAPSSSTWWRRLADMSTPTARPELQVAADGAWEDAAVVPLPSEAAAVVLAEVADAAHTDVAIEVMWPGEVFVGVRWPRTALAEASAALDQIAAVVRGTTPVAPVAAMLTALLGADPRDDVTLLELGAVGAWRSTGPELLWRADRPGQLPAVVDLRFRPDLQRNRRPLAVEVGADTPWPHWIGLVVSRPDGDRHRLDPDALAGVLAVLRDRPGGARPDR